MANTFQQQSLQRKLIYFGLIVVLFTAALFVRGSMGAQASKLEIREENLGDVELTSSSLRLLMSGLRGFVICGLWWDANEKQMKHEWNQLDQRVRVLVKLQPHFISPWLFQSWNLAYNVSVEFDRVKDKYFYIARGIQLLAEGERQNKDNPEMRFFIGNYTQSKMGISDENNTLRSLFQMSCIDPTERNPARFRQANGEFDWQAFQDFCEKHPVLVRRLHDHLGCQNPDDIVEFLAANYKIPGRFEDVTEERSAQGQEVSRFKPEGDRFPVLPAPRASSREQDDEATKYALREEYTNDSPLTDSFESYECARAWYVYSQLPLDYKNRRARYMAQILFQGYPARAQFYVGERREQEGWFDEDGWVIGKWFPESQSQPDGPKRPVALGTGRKWAGDAWEKAYQMYLDHGERHNLLKTREQELELEQTDPKAYRDYIYERNLSNFNHFYFKALVEKTTEAVTARKLFYEAEELHKQAEDLTALKRYEDPRALGPPDTWFPRSKATGWKRLLLAHSDFRHDTDVEEDTYIIQRKYQRLVRKERGTMLKRLLEIQDFLTRAALPPGPGTYLVPSRLSPNFPLPLQGPFDDVDDEGKPLISREARDRVIGRHGPAPGEALPPPPPPPTPSETSRTPRAQPR
jgi:hypothetical protein